MPPKISGSQSDIPLSAENEAATKEKTSGKTGDSREVKAQEETKPQIPRSSNNNHPASQTDNIQRRAVSAVEPDARNRVNSSVSTASGITEGGIDSRRASVASSTASFDSAFSDGDLSDRDSLYSSRGSLSSDTGSISSTDSAGSTESGIYTSRDSLISNASTSSSVSKNSSIGAAGHSDTFVRVGDGHIGKLTSKSEADVYNNRSSLFLDSILPKSQSLSELTDDELHSLSPLQNRAEADDMAVIVPEMLGKDIPEKRKFEMDIKIGSRTASHKQLQEMEHSSPLKKVMKHKVMDTVYGSSSRGYRLEGLKIKGKKPESNRLKLTQNSKQYIKKVVQQAGPENKDKILSDLKKMTANLAIAKATFVASSALFLIDKDNPENTQVKLIDVAHPIYPSSDDFTAIKNDNIKSLNKLTNYISNLKISNLKISKPKINKPKAK